MKFSISTVLKGAFFVIIAIIAMQSPFDFEIIPVSSDPAVAFVSEFAAKPRKAKPFIDILFGVIGFGMAVFACHAIGLKLK